MQHPRRHIAVIQGGCCWRGLFEPGNILDGVYLKREDVHFHCPLYLFHLMTRYSASGVEFGRPISSLWGYILGAKKRYFIIYNIYNIMLFLVYAIPNNSHFCHYRAKKNGL
jgi:hypothetical protein